MPTHYKQLQSMSADALQLPSFSGFLQEENMQGAFVTNPHDLSSTEPYQRDNLAHFFV